jgi:hypothetical protein
VNDRHNLRHFVASDVRWAELDVRRDPFGRLVLRHDSFTDAPWSRGEELLLLRDCLEGLTSNRRSVKIDLKEGGDVIDEVIGTLARFGFSDGDMWFNGAVSTIGSEGFARLRHAHPRAVLQSPVDFVVPVLLAARELAEDVLTSMRGWGLTRVSLDWATSSVREALDLIDRIGWEVNLYGVPDLEAFLEAALLLPTSVTADFNFPEGNYHGRGPLRGVAVAASSS